MSKTVRSLGSDLVRAGSVATYRPNERFGRSWVGRYEWLCRSLRRTDSFAGRSLRSDLPSGLVGGYVATDRMAWSVAT
ncbi:hypothetical protein F2Q70_00013162 [Brassica cretica]|uniref:Uncharacterized protein n=1 Tax=Brassica cretica TaxID=69181 RepID=A0A8S9M6T0_BRACR|nr:hypothetical protein F2Q70_00013162 [Brassica cretica]